MPLRSLRAARLGLALVAGCSLSATAGAQLIQIKTLPIADGDQWRIFPSANAGMADGKMRHWSIRYSIRS